MIRSYFRWIAAGLLPILFFSCTKYLEEKRNQGLATPSTVGDLQAVLNAGIVSNIGAVNGEYMGDDHFMTLSQYNAQSVSVREFYTWDSKGDGYVQTSWVDMYDAVYKCNFILDYLPLIKISAAEQQQAAYIKGNALYGRAFAFYTLAQSFCKPYSNTAANDPGIVIRMTATVSVASTRATVQASYDQIIADLKEAETLLPVTALKTEATRAAAQAMLARVYLSMRDYTNAGLYAEKVLTSKNTLLDYNTLPSSSGSVMPAINANPEVIQVSGRAFVVFEPQFSNVDSTLYASYATNDLRKAAFFTPSGNSGKWKGTYGGDFANVPQAITTGPCVDEMYLVRAECRARSNNKDGAMDDLNALLVKRWKTGTYTNLAAVDATDALQKVLVERRKELVFRDLRWSDIRRLNLEGANITLTRIVGTSTYTLPPNDKRSVVLIPEREIMYSGISQNPR